MSDTISKLIKISLWIIGILIPGEEIYSQNQYTFNIVEIQHVYELPEQYCIVVENIHSGERFLIETTNNSLPIKENTDSISEIYPNEPDFIHVGDTLSIEIAPKYEFMQSLIGLSCMYRTVRHIAIATYQANTPLSHGRWHLQT